MLVPAQLYYDCSYNSGKCNDCLFENSTDCKEYKKWGINQIYE